MEGMDKVGLTKSLIKLFVTDHHKRAGHTMSKKVLKDLKTKQFNIIGNFHSFFCVGDKNYGASMANVKIFNLTKALAN